jgi:hypothetical protein
MRLSAKEQTALLITFQENLKLLLEHHGCADL